MVFLVFLVFTWVSEGFFVELFGFFGFWAFLVSPGLWAPLALHGLIGDLGHTASLGTPGLRSLSPKAWGWIQGLPFGSLGSIARGTKFPNHGYEKVSDNDAFAKALLRIHEGILMALYRISIRVQSEVWANMTQIHTQTQTKTNRHRQRQTETDKDRQTQTDTDRHRQTP